MKHVRKTVGSRCNIKFAPRAYGPIAFDRIQQIKDGMLDSMGSINDLVDSNKLYIQLLASVLAYLLDSLGTCLFFTALYSLRSRGFMPAKYGSIDVTNIDVKMV